MTPKTLGDKDVKVEVELTKSVDRCRIASCPYALFADSSLESSLL
jgi:hypothetical protein